MNTCDRRSCQMNRIAIWASALLLATPNGGSLKAQDSVVISTGVEHVVTGGYWKVEGHDGQLCAIVVNTGWEHVTSRLVVQWLEARADSHDIVVRQSLSVDAIPPNQWSLGVPRFVMTAGGPYLRISGTQAYTLAEKSWRFRLGRPGSITSAPPP